MSYTKSNKLHIVAVTAAIRNEQGKYLVLKRSEREIAYPGMFTFPGGKVEDNDTVEQTLNSEALEEANLKLKPGKIFLYDKVFTRPDNQTVKVFSYLCEAENPEDVRIHPDDFTEYQWVTLEELRSLPHVGLEEDIIQAEKLLSLNIDINVLSTPSLE